MTHQTFNRERAPERREHRQGCDFGRFRGKSENPKVAAEVTERTSEMHGIAGLISGIGETVNVYRGLRGLPLIDGAAWHGNFDIRQHTGPISIHRTFCTDAFHDF